MSANKSAIVTGGAGFIGSHLAEELVRQGYRVIILGDLSRGKLADIAHLLSLRSSINSRNSTDSTNSTNPDG